MYPHFQPSSHHPQRVANAPLIIENEFLGQQVQHFAIGGKRNRSRLVDRHTNLISRDLSRARAEAHSTLAVDSANVRPRNSHRRMFNGSTRNVLRLLNRLLNRCHSLVELDDHAFARAA